MQVESKSCFVIGPIGSSLAPVGSEARKTYEDALEVLEQVIAPACAEVGLLAVRADAISASGDLTEQIFRHLRFDDVVIADLTGANPNVMYELGLRHTVDKLTIQLGEFDSLPFDIGSIRTIQFSRSPHGLVQARNKLVQALSVGLADGGDLLPATRIWSASQSPSSAVVVVADDSSESDEDGLGVFEQMAEVEQLLPELAEITNAISLQVTELGNRAQPLGPEIEELNLQNAPTSARLSLIARFADSIDEPAAELELLSVQFADRMKKIDGVVTGILRFWQDQPQVEVSVPFLESLGSLAESTRSGMDGLGAIVPGLKMMAELSRTLRKPVSRIVDAVALLVRSTNVIDTWASEAKLLLQR